MKDLNLNRRLLLALPLIPFSPSVAGKAEGRQVYSSGKPLHLFFPAALIHGAPHAISIRSRRPNLPILLFLHGGPGYAMLDFFHHTLPELEQHFVVVSYDQRGAGLSYSRRLDPKTLTLRQLVDDAHEITRFALKKLQRSDSRVVILAHSMGTMLGLNLIKKHPESYEAYIGAGQVVNVVENEQAMYDFALSQAVRHNKAQALTELLCIGRPLDDMSYRPSPNPLWSCTQGPADPYELTSKWMGFFGGELRGKTSSEEVENAILSSKVYAGKYQQWFQGLHFSQNLFDDPQVLSWNARVLHRTHEKPLYFFMGRYDHDTPASLAETYVSQIQSRSQLIWFEHSAHFPFYEEKSEFLKQLLKITRTLPQL